MTDAQDRWIEVEGLRTHYLSAGEAGSPVLLLHGGGLDSAHVSYRFSLEPVSREHRVYAPDWPGYGESGPPPRGQCTVEYYVGFLGHLMDALGLERAALVGISLGGGIALGFALRSPERVDRLVLVDSYGLGREIPFGALSYLTIRLPLVNELTWVALSRSRAMVRWSLRSIVHDPKVITDELVDEVWRLSKKPGIAEAWQCLQRSEATWSGLRTDYTGRLHEVRTPTLIFHGADDRLVPVAWAERAHRLIPGSELCVLPDCGHWLPREEPEEFNRRLLQFLAAS